MFPVRACGRAAQARRPAEAKETSFMTIRSHALSRVVAALVLLFATVPAWAAPPPRVVVSLPPLHSLVARLLENVATPELLMKDQVRAHLTELDATQIDAVRRADLVVWSGPELEGAIAEAGLVMPDLASRTLTLSRYVPLITPTADGSDQPGPARDLRFWLDPRLTHHAIHMIAPALVRLYPDASDTILDNEIALIAELHHTEHATRAALGTAEGTPLHLVGSDLRYLEWRFNLPVVGCARGNFDPLGFNLTAGPALYGRLMDGARDTLAACLGTPAAKTARHGGDHTL